ncbi:MAG TPA: hemolysin III family protein [Bacteroidales bacterium]|nr:hemolysin III family protein [Bacteroidales bacterium]
MVAAIRAKRFSGGEDMANAISHLAGTLLAIAGLVLMVVFSAIKGNAWHIVSSSVFGTSMIFLYSCSTIAHWLPEGAFKDRFFVFDQAAVFILIAGTYTPLALVALRGALGWTIFGLEWLMALTGIARVISRAARFEDGVGLPDILIYVFMGWLVVLLSGPVLKSVSLMGYIWILAGGLFYSIGIVFFRFTRFRYSHLVWHLMVIAGSVSHFTAIFFYVIP